MTTTGGAEIGEGQEVEVDGTGFGCTVCIERIRLSIFSEIQSILLLIFTSSAACLGEEGSGIGLGATN